MAEFTIKGVDSLTTVDGHGSLRHFEFPYRTTDPGTIRLLKQHKAVEVPPAPKQAAPPVEKAGESK